MLLADLSAYHVQALRARRRSPLTIEKYAAAERLFCAYLAADLGRPPLHSDLTLPCARAFLAYLEDEHRAETPTRGRRGHGAVNIAFYAAVLKAWSACCALEWEDAHGVALWPRGDPLARLKRPAVPRTVTPILAQVAVERLLAVAGETRQPRRNRAILAFLRYTGVRVEELCTLRVDDIELGSSKHAGRAKVHGKGERERYVFWGGTCGRELARYLTGERPAGGPWLFVSQRGGRLSKDAVQEMLRLCGERAGVRGVHPHLFRHTFATRYLQKHPGQLEHLRRLLGHATLQMTLRYARLAEADLEGRVEEWDD